MSPIAGQTAGPNGLKFFVNTQWFQEGVIDFKKTKFFLFSNFPRAMPGPSAS